MDSWHREWLGIRACAFLGCYVCVRGIRGAKCGGFGVPCVHELGVWVHVSGSNGAGMEAALLAAGTQSLEGIGCGWSGAVAGPPAGRDVRPCGWVD